MRPELRKKKEKLWKRLEETLNWCRSRKNNYKNNSNKIITNKNKKSYNRNKNRNNRNKNNKNNSRSRKKKQRKKKRKERKRVAMSLMTGMPILPQINPSLKRIPEMTGKWLLRKKRKKNKIKKKNVVLDMLKVKRRKVL